VYNYDDQSCLRIVISFYAVQIRVCDLFLYSLVFRYLRSTKDKDKDTGVNVNFHPGARWGLIGKRRGFDKNRILKGVGYWEIFVFNRP